MLPRASATLDTPNRQMARMAAAPRVVSEALRTVERIAREHGIDWALVGGQALVAHGVPRDTLDADALVDRDKLGTLAHALCDAGWQALVYDGSTREFRVVDAPTTHYFDDPVLFDCGEERAMVPLRSPDGLDVDLIAAQHPVEVEMVLTAAPLRLYEVSIPVAPLGGVMLVKAKADRLKDVAALEQSAEHLSGRVTDAAVAWARRHDPSTAEDLDAILRTAQARKTPKRTEPTGRGG